MLKSPKKIFVVINPASGNNEPILNSINDVFMNHDVEWQVSVTTPETDATTLISENISADVDAVAVYGGDGTVLDAANALIGSDTPLVILPGGTANALADELCIPNKVESALELIFQGDASIKAIDVVQVNNRYFLLRIGTGMVSTFSRSVDREMKDRYGNIAYIIGALKAVTNPENIHFKLTVDGQDFESDGVACLITNATVLGMLGLRLSPDIRIDDGLLHAYIVDQSIQSVLGVMGNLAAIEEIANNVTQYHGNQIKVETTPVSDWYADGEDTPIVSTPFTCKIEAAALKIIVPPQEN